MPPTVLGAVVDDQTRCTHYHTDRDVVAIKFACCQDWYPCYRCHDEASGHAIRPWSADQRDEQAVLCGVCRSIMTIADYLQTDRCAHCGAAFNPGCANHWSIYFDVGDLSVVGDLPTHCDKGQTVTG